MAEPPVSDGIEIETARPERTADFWAERERMHLSESYGFRVVWHEQSHDIIATRGGTIIGALRMRISASLAHLDAVFVEPAERACGIGRTLLDRAEDTAIYYNCHKVTLSVPADGTARLFFERCGYRAEAVLQQHTFKLDVAILRKFLL